jgi:membrane protein
VRTREIIGAFRREYAADALGDLAAMLTYYALFALFPMIVFVMTLALLVVPPSALAQGIDLVTHTMPADAAEMVRQYIFQLRAAAGGGIAVASVLIALWGASRGAVALGRALNTVFDRRDTRSWLRIQLTAVAVTFGVALIMIVALGLLAAGPALGRFLAERFGYGDVFAWVWAIGRWVVAAFLVMLSWGLMYRFLPDNPARGRLVSLGSFLGVLVWVGASLLFALYVGHFASYDKTYGALGAVIIFITWLWISNLALLIGAEINYVVDVLGSRHAARDVPRGLSHLGHGSSQPV